MPSVASLIFAVTIICTQAAYYDYCKLQCDNGYTKEVHLKCSRKDCGVDKSKCNEFEVIPMTNKLKQIILKEHNTLRNHVARGLETRGTNGPQPQAANMMTLKYNDELGSIAQCWANTCQTTKHSICHRTWYLPFVGQNIASRFSTAKYIYNDVEGAIKKMINSWYEEVELFDRNHIRPYYFQSGIGHYTLMVWGDIQEIGCGLAKFKSDEWYTISIVCNYGSTQVAGNIIGGEMYKVGRPCTACPTGTRSNPKYKALCEDVPRTNKKYNAEDGFASENESF